MDWLAYLDEQRHTAQYESLLLRTYNDHPAFGHARLSSFRRFLSLENPAREFVRWKNVLVVRADAIHAHACISVDSRDTGVAHVGFVDFDSGQSCERLFEAIDIAARDLGAHTLRGPINFNSWQEFRCITRDSGAPPFFLEPALHERSEIWRGHGFMPKVSYLSLGQSVQQAPFGDRETPGITIERLTPSMAFQAVPGLHSVALDAFGSTWDFIPISLAEFSYLYQPALAQSGTFLILVARDEQQKIVGFFVGAPDVYDKGQKTLVLKSVAVLRSHKRQGVGTALFLAVHRFALAQGFDRYIYSTMQDENMAIQNLVGAGEFIRAYEVGEKAL
ncbi:MAG: GNAT family N-acetyltransferase [Patescibacteria group bacterium]